MYRSDTEDAKRIHAVILSDDVNGYDNTGDRTEFNGNYIEPRKVTSRVQKTRHRMKIVAINWTLLAIVSMGKEKRKWCELKCSTHSRSRWQNILTKLLGFTGQARKASSPFETMKGFITDEIYTMFFNT